MFQNLPSEVSIYEVSPRDGLQNEAVTVPTHQKLRLIRALMDAGVRRIEVTSFVSPNWIPQLADGDQVARMLGAMADRPAHVTLSALCPNGRGLERAVTANVDEVCVFVSASETHNQKNVNRSIDDSIQGFREVVQPAIQMGMRVRGYISTMWGCPFEGAIKVESGVRIAESLLEMGCYQVSLGDTIGVGTPLQTRDIVATFLKRFPIEQVALHLHDTRGTALANALVGLDMGIRTFDGSVGGLGGCPYAPGAAGNVATEDLVYMLHGMGIQTGVDLDKLWDAGQVARSLVGHELPGKVHKAGVRSLRM